MARPRSQVGALAFDQAGLLIDVPTRQVHEVNLSALAVWASIDGATPLEAIVDDLAAAYATEPAAIGPDIESIVREFHRLGLVEIVPTGGTGVGDDRPGLAAPSAVSPCIDRELVEIDGHRYLVLPPSSCQDGIDHQGWLPVRALAVGDHRLGVRGDSPATDATLASAFAAHLVDDPRVGPNYSVVLPADDSPATNSPSAGPASRRPGVYEGSQWLGTPTEPAAIIQTLARHLAASVPGAPPALRLAALAVIGDLGAVLAPWYRGTIDPRLVALGDRPGWSRHDPPVWIEPGSARVVVDPPNIEVDLSSVGGPRRAERTDPRPLTGIVVPGTATARLEGPAAVAALVSWLVVAPADDTDALLDELVALTRRVPVITAAADDLPDVAAALVRSRD